MSRMIAASLLTLFAVSMLLATDVDKYPPGHKPFHSPKAPCPNGVLGDDTCFGHYATRWTPWNAACNQCGVPMTTTQIGQSVTQGNAAIILWDTPLSTAPSATIPSTMVPAPESVKPMPPAKK